jgi:hypothetical protein
VRQASQLIVDSRAGRPAVKCTTPRPCRSIALRVCHQQRRLHQGRRAGHKMPHSSPVLSTPLQSYMKLRGLTCCSSTLPARPALPSSPSLRAGSPNTAFAACTHGDWGCPAAATAARAASTCALTTAAQRSAAADSAISSSAAKLIGSLPLSIRMTLRRCGCGLSVCCCRCLCCC